MAHRATCGLLAALLYLSTTPLMAGEYYKWVDSDGVTHFSEKPVLGADAKKVRTTTKTEEAASPAADAAASPNNNAEAPAASAPAAVDPKQQEFCRTSKERLKSLQSGQRIRMVQPDGSFAYLDAQQVKDEINRTQDALRSTCSPSAAQ
jgi:uncharacterized protein YcgI (DUF1989 family)